MKSEETNLRFEELEAVEELVVPMDISYGGGVAGAIRKLLVIILS